MSGQTLTCDVCNGESGGEYLGVACIPGAPMSIAWCRKCLEHEARPLFYADYLFIHVANGDLQNLAEWAAYTTVWLDGRYMDLGEYVKRITPEMVQKELEAYAKACEESWEDEEVDDAS